MYIFVFPREVAVNIGWTAAPLLTYSYGAPVALEGKVEKAGVVFPPDCLEPPSIAY